MQASVAALVPCGSVLSGLSGIKRIPSLEFIDVFGKQTRDPVGCAFGPARPDFVQLIAQDPFEGSGKLLQKDLQEGSKTGVHPCNCPVALPEQLEDQSLVRTGAASGQDPQGLVERRLALAFQHPAKGVLMDSRLLRDILARAVADRHR